MKDDIKSLDAHQLLESFMVRGHKSSAVFKEQYDQFYVARLEDLTEISRPPIPPTKSESHILMLFTGGKTSLKVGSEVVKAEARKCVVIPAGQVFSYSELDSSQEQAGTGYICGFKPDFLLQEIANAELLQTFEFLAVWANPVIALSAEVELFVLRLFERLYAEFRASALENRRLLQAYCLSLLNELQLLYQPLFKAVNSRSLEITNRFRDLLQKNVQREHQASKYAAMLNVSPNHLNKCVRQVTGKSPSLWIQGSIVNEAKVWLAQTDLSIQQVAFAIGLSDPAYFSRLFKKMEACSPMQFRKMIDLS